MRLEGIYTLFQMQYALGFPLKENVFKVICVTMTQSHLCYGSAQEDFLGQVSEQQSKGFFGS